MASCMFVSDLHGEVDRYGKLFEAIENEGPDAVFMGGDILPSIVSSAHHESFIEEFLSKNLLRLRSKMHEAYPAIFIIPGNDDYRSINEELDAAAGMDLLVYLHDRVADFRKWRIYGYAFTPPSPFMLKDWEKYDVSRYVDPGCVSPEEGFRTTPISIEEMRYGTIAGDLEKLAGMDSMENAVFLFHAPPYRTAFDRAGLDDRRVDGIPMDVNVGSIAIRRFIEDRQPLLTLHGHIHESVRLTGSWKDSIGRTVMFSAAHDGPELAMVRFDLDDLLNAGRTLI